MSSRIHRALCGSALLLFCATAAAFDGPVALTLEQAQKLATARSRQIASGEHAAAAARELAAAAGQLPDPVLQAGIDNLPVSGADRFSLGRDFMTMRRIGVSQELTGAGKRQLRARRLEIEADKALAEKDLALVSVERDTALAWIDRYYLEAMLLLLAEQRDQGQRELEAAQAGYQGGKGSQAEVLAAQSALALLADRGAELEQRLRGARLQLARWTGADLPLAGRPGVDRLDREPDLARHPELAVLARQEEAAGAEASLARANRRPDWTVAVALQQRGPGYPNMLSFGVSIPLQWDRAQRQDRELAARLAGVEQARAQREEAARSHAAETGALLNEWQSKRDRAARYASDILPLARRRSEALLASYGGGKAALAEVLSARRTELDLRVQALQLDADGARLWAQLNFLTPESK